MSGVYPVLAPNAAALNTLALALANNFFFNAAECDQVTFGVNVLPGAGETVTVNLVSATGNTLIPFYNGAVQAQITNAAPNTVTVPGGNFYVLTKTANAGTAVGVDAYPKPRSGVQ